MVRFGQPFRSFSAALLLACGVVGCHKRPALPQPPPASAPPPVVVAPKPPAPPAAPSRPPAPRAVPADDESSRFARMSLDALNATHPLVDVRFDFDASDLSSEARTALESDARWLTKWPSTAILIEGHADERGTAEYNLALGERRASVTRSYLENLGVAAVRLKVVSKGEEAPDCTEHVEACWSQNRRAHLVITSK